MSRTLDVYFDYLSPYAYLAWRCLPAVTQPRGVEIVPRPVLFAGLLNHWGQLGPAEIPPKGTHVFKETARFAALRNIPLRLPRYHPFKPLTALRLSLAAVAGDQQTAVITALFNAGWGTGIDLGDPDDICTALNQAGLDGAELLAAAQTPEAKEALRTETQAAVAVGVFGVPTMVIDDELFWGLDQLSYLAMYLDGEDPLNAVDASARSSQGRAIVRPGSIGRGQDNDGNVVQRSSSSS